MKKDPKASMNLTVVRLCVCAHHWIRTQTMAIGKRQFIYMIVNLPTADMIATISEPLLTMFNCKLDFQPVMS